MKRVLQLEVERFQVYIMYEILHHLQLCALASLPFAGADEDNYVPSNEIKDDDQHEHGIYIPVS